MEMKASKLIRPILATIGLFAVSTLSANIINMGGTNARIDTLESWQCGPSTTYSHLQMTKGSKVRHMYLLDVNLNDTNVNLEVVISKEKLQTYEGLSAMSTRLDAPGHRMIGGINSNFWCVGATVTAAPNEYDGQLGLPLQGCVSNGKMGTDVTDWDRVNAGKDSANWDIGHLAITSNRKAVVCDMREDNWMAFKGVRCGIRDVNRPRTYTQEDRLSLYNSFGGTTPKGLTSKEVVFAPIGEWAINQQMACIVSNINTTGGTTLTGKMGALQGFGGGLNHLNELQVGDTFILNTGILTRADSIRHDIRQMVAGNALVMVNGNLTKRNYNEGYNSGDYPRPVLGTNATGDRVWLLECAPTGGMTTAEACYVLRDMGATDAGAYDGGGSAQMYLLGEYKFKTTESSPRSLPLGLWVVSKAPDSEDAGKMEFLSPLTSIPAYASYTPTLRAWTKEGNLISHDYKKHTLSCEPETLGTISADGLTFTANPVNASGLLVATYGTTRAETPIEIKDGQVQIILDSIVLGNRDYEIEVEAIAGNISLPMSPKALSWKLLDETNAPCSVNEDGLLHAIQPGRAQVVGALSQFSDTLQVIVETATAPQLSAANSALCIMHFVLPKDTSFAFSSTRNASITLPVPMRLWGNPDSILVVINTSSPVQSMEMTCRAANAKQAVAYKLSGTTEPNVDYTFHFAVDKVIEDHSRGIYPLYLESLKCGMKDPTKNKEYTFTLKDIILCYRDWAEVTDLESLSASLPYSLSAQKIMVNGQLYILKNNKIYTIHGNESK